LKLIDTPIKLNFLKLITRLSLLNNCEICGLGVKNSLFFLKNIAPDKKTGFLVDPIDYFGIFNKSKIDFCFHSHPEGSCNPSSMDIEMSQNALIDFLIFSVRDKKFSLYNPVREETIYFSI
tara:strand:- start:2264 stop:2626 length:363 start_codon:yes stop_codon:yes gene_type:complete